MSLETARKVVDTIFQSPRKKLTIEFQGGESTLNFDTIKKVVTLSKQKAKNTEKIIKFLLTTNLTNLNSEQIQYFKQKKINISTSLDGPLDLHNANRILENGKPTYNIVTNNIKKLQNEGVPVGALMVTTRQSLDHPEEIVDEYIRQGMKYIQLKPMSRLGYAEKNWKNIGHTQEEFNKFYERALNHIIEQNKKGTTIIERYALLALRKILTQYDPCFSEMSSPCGAAKTQITYDYDGNIYTCDEGRTDKTFKIGNVAKNSLKECITCKAATKISAASKLEGQTECDKCTYQPYCGTCPLINKNVYNNINIAPSETDRCKHHKFIFDTIFYKLTEPETKNIFINWLKQSRQHIYS